MSIGLNSESVLVSIGVNSGPDLVSNGLNSESVLVSIGLNSGSDLVYIG